jgi:hypothetical protein
MDSRGSSRAETEAGDIDSIGAKRTQTSGGFPPPPALRAALPVTAWELLVNRFVVLLVTRGAALIRSRLAMPNFEDLQNQLAALRREVADMMRDGCTPAQILKLQRECYRLWASLEARKSEHTSAKAAAGR